MVSWLHPGRGAASPQLFREPFWRLTRSRSLPATLHTEKEGLGSQEKDGFFEKGVVVMRVFVGDDGVDEKIGGKGQKQREKFMQ